MSLSPQLEAQLTKLEMKILRIEKEALKIRKKIESLRKKIFEGKFVKKRKGATYLFIRHLDQMSGTFRLMEASYILKGEGMNKVLATLRRKKVTDPLKREAVIFKGPVKKGSYTLVVRAKVRGYSSIFTYLNKYKLRLFNQYKFGIEKGRSVAIDVLFIDIGGVDVKSRLKIRFKIRKK